MPRTPRVVTFAELFAGIGGFRAGLEAAAGAPPVPAVACEILESARRIYAANFGAESLTAAPVQRLDRLPACDLLMAGFPCQSYTEQAGKRRRGFRDPRGQLFWHVVRLLAASELADDYEYSAYNDGYDDYDELGPYYDYDDEDAYYGGGYEDVEDVDESLYADYYDEYESSRR